MADDEYEPDFDDNDFVGDDIDGEDIDDAVDDADAGEGNIDVSLSWWKDHSQFQSSKFKNQLKIPNIYGIQNTQ